MSTTSSEASGSPESPMEVIVLEEDDGDTITQEEKQNKKPEGSRKDLSKT